MKAATNGDSGGSAGMAGVRLTVELLAPLCLAEDAAQGNETRTLSYVPGSALRGALAWHLLQGGEWRSDEDAFRAAFADDGVSFGDLTPGPGGRVVPLSARSCKLHSGFAADGGHGVVDLLLLAARLSREPDAAEPLPGACRRCGSALKAFGGRFAVGDEPRSASVPRSFHRFAARDPRTRAVQHSLLFTT